MRSRKQPAAAWLDIAWRGTAMTIEAQQVIALRLMRFAAGAPDSRREAVRMVTEKVDAALRAQAAMLGAGHRPARGAGKAVTIYAKRVRSNRRRLSRG